jgi:hypothetical protein
VKILGNLSGELSLRHDVTLLDLGEGGARLEHAGRFAPGAICFLRLPGPKGELLLKARVVHSMVSRTVPVPGGEPTLLYHNGLEFVGLTSDALLVLRKLLADVGRGAFCA